ncbi:hypothetical protein CesoFtcFv8_005551 [Champsocephalus esox]|uniref:Uncharacterized protein n=1 Tax=Champsocephalus esox TaxID=159716 RepID=A0AAN8HCQ4_9TELE|nr:hypothetical protein CesoFtcFv8_005551 [Champsocephalus esox]
MLILSQRARPTDTLLKERARSAYDPEAGQLVAAHRCATPQRGHQEQTQQHATELPTSRSRTAPYHHNRHNQQHLVHP